MSKEDEMKDATTQTQRLTTRNVLVGTEKTSFSPLILNLSSNPNI